MRDPRTPICRPGLIRYFGMESAESSGEGSHPVEVSLRPERTIKPFREMLDREYLLVKFTQTRGGTELGFKLDKARSDLTPADLEAQTGKGESAPVSPVETMRNDLHMSVLPSNMPAAQKPAQSFVNDVDVKVSGACGHDAFSGKPVKQSILSSLKDSTVPTSSQCLGLSRSRSWVELKMICLKATQHP